MAQLRNREPKAPPEANGSGTDPLPTDKDLRRYKRRLQEEEGILEDLRAMRGLTDDTVRAFDIGWSDEEAAYTIPIYDEADELVNVRFYQLKPRHERRKIWSVKGHGSPPTLYPISALHHDGALIVCEGEWDALVTTQAGFPAITRTAGANTWLAPWSKALAGREVYLCHDCDKTGEAGNRKVGESLLRAGAEVRVIRLPYPIIEKHGRDLSDYWQEYNADDFLRLIADAQPFDPTNPDPRDLDPRDSSVLDSFDSEQAGEPLRLTVTIKGRREPGYTIPRELSLECGQDAGKPCATCPLAIMDGSDTFEVGRSNPVVLELMDAPKRPVMDALRALYGLPKCDRVTVSVVRSQAVEILFARPSIEHIGGAQAGDFKSIKLTSVGRHDTTPNTTVQVVGALTPNPKTQLNEFLTWDVTRTDSTLDDFVADRATLHNLRKFRPAEGEKPLAKLADIARDLAEHVTHTYGRPELHAALDLVWHSALGFSFAGEQVPRGWMELLVVGDTRTGKSKAAAALARHYDCGEVVNCETATFAGVVGGLQQFGASKEWAVTWGAIPINDRRLVVLDEVASLGLEDIGRMSDIRSRGVAELVKIQQEKALSRTRLIWLGNPRDDKPMKEYTYGVQAIAPLIGRREDIARFDLAMTLFSDEVALSSINRAASKAAPVYTADACRSLLRWVWSRTPEQVEWEPGAEDLALSLAAKLGKAFIESPPLIQAADVRIKLARISVAIAARLFSTNDLEAIYVKKEHVRAGHDFVMHLYSLASFGYGTISGERLRDDVAAEESRATVAQFLGEWPGLSHFLRTTPTGRFKSPDLQEVLNVQRDAANGIVAKLVSAKMVRKDGGFVIIEPALHRLLRELP